MRMSVMGQGRARVGCCSVAGTDCSAPAAILDAFLRLEEKGIVKPGESKKGLEMGILGPVHHSNVVTVICIFKSCEASHRSQHRIADRDTRSDRSS